MTAKSFGKAQILTFKMNDVCHQSKNTVRNQLLQIKRKKGIEVLRFDQLVVFLSLLNFHTLGGALTVTGFGAIAGVPLMIAGAAVGGSGGVIIGGAYIGEIIKKNLKLKEVTKVLNDDRFQCIRIVVLITRARREDEIANGIGVSQEDAAIIFSVVVRGIGHILPAATIGRGIAYGMIRAASTWLNIAGAILSDIMIPIDIAQFIIAAVSIFKNNKSGVVDEVDRLAEGLEISSWITLRSLGFHVVFLEKYTEFKTVECTVLAVKEEAIEIHLTEMQLNPSRYEENSRDGLAL